jgi:hypothetical protein
MNRDLERKLMQALVVIMVILAPSSFAAPPVYEITIQNHLFEPDEIRIPANTKVKLVIHNRDPTPEEFESFELNREKIIMGGSKATVFIGPLPPGEYPFFGEFNPDTALGKILVEEDTNAR